MEFDLTKDAEEIQWLAVKCRELHEKQRSVSKLRWKSQDVAADVERLKSEFAVARVLGIEPTVSRALGKDPGYDGIYKTWTYEVKQTARQKGRLIYNPRLHEFYQDIWVLAVTLPDSWVARVAGWVWREYMPGLWVPFYHDPTAFCLEMEQLAPIETLRMLPWEIKWEGGK